MFCASCFYGGGDSLDLVNTDSNVLTSGLENEEEVEEKIHQNEEISEDNSPNSKVTAKLMDINNRQRQRLTDEFDKLKSSTVKEMQRSKQLLASLKTLRDVETGAGFKRKDKDKDLKDDSTDDQSDLDKTIKTLEESINRFELQIKLDYFVIFLLNLCIFWKEHF